MKPTAKTLETLASRIGDALMFEGMPWMETVMFSPEESDIHLPSICTTDTHLFMIAEQVVKAIAQKAFCEATPNGLGYRITLAVDTDTFDVHQQVLKQIAQAPNAIQLAIGHANLIETWHQHRAEAAALSIHNEEMEMESEPWR